MHLKETEKEIEVKRPCRMFPTVCVTTEMTQIKSQVGVCLRSLWRDLRRSERAADMPLGCLLQMLHPGGICRTAPQPASFSQWKGPEVKDGKHRQLEHKHKSP